MRVIVNLIKRSGSLRPINWPSPDKYSGVALKVIKNYEKFKNFGRIFSNI